MSRKENDAFERIATFSYPHEAAILVVLLEGEGIHCFLQDQETITANPLLSNAIGGVKLKVHKKDAARAREILEALNNESAFVDDENAFPIGETENGTDTRTGKVCPKCLSDDIHREKIDPAFFVIGILFLGFPFLFLKGKYHCYNCGNEWR